MPAAELSGSTSRNKKFVPDPDLGSAGSQLADYTRFGYDRGHQAPDGDFKSSQQLMDQSFYLSNTAPQVGMGVQPRSVGLSGGLHSVLASRGFVSDSTS